MRTQFSMAARVNADSAEYISTVTLAIRKAAKDPPSYQYIPLKHLDEIRILVLEPDDGTVSIRCFLKHVRLSERPTYEGLSYVWGDPSKLETVICDGKLIRITKSLHTALRYLRLKSSKRVLWADAICINQDVDTEKNQQVALMGQIYSQTSVTNIWLGEDEDGSGKRAFEHVRMLSEVLRGISTGSAEVRQRLITTGHTTGKDFDAWVSHFLSDQVVTPILQNPWFDRLWCLQEAVLSSQLILNFGPARLDCSSLHYFILEYASPLIAAPLSVHVDMISTGKFFNMGRYTMEVGDGLDILTLMKETLPSIGYKCQDPRDQIYALLGMSHCRGFDADYTLDVDTTFKRFASWTISPEQPYGLAILQIARGDSQCLCAVPSWSPCYDMERPPASLIRDTSKRDTDFNASGYKLGMTRNIFSENSSVLRVKGLVVDMADHISLDSSLLGGFHRRSRKNIDMLMAFVGIIIMSLEDDKYKRFCTALTFGLRHKIYHEDMSPEYLSESEHLQLIHQCIMLGHHENLDADISILWASRYFCITAAQRFSWVPQRAQSGDQVVILYGSEVPHVIRQQLDGAYKYIGECWIEGFMNGEVFGMPNFEWPDIRLI
jgi:hypothetical protein